MPLDNVCRYRHSAGLTISQPHFPTPELGVQGYPYMCPVEVRVFTIAIGVGI